MESAVMLVLQLLLFTLTFPQAVSRGSGHSLWVLATYISGKTPFPEFTAVLMLDDIQTNYYDSETDRVLRVGGEEEEELEGLYVLRKIFSSMRKRLMLVKDRFNLTTGVHVQQRLQGCEVQGDGQPALIMYRDGTNGQDIDSVMYNTTHFTYSVGNQWGIEWDAVRKTFEQIQCSNFYLPLCVRTLKILLEREKHLVMRRVPPRVRVLTKQVVGGAQVTCLATDFYPRHINLTLLRDGRPVDQQDLSGGLVLPNGNGLYQVRTTLTVSAEELRRRHRYTCTTSHLSLDNRLEVSWRAEASQSHMVAAVSVPVGLTLAALLLTALLWWRRRRRFQDSKSEVVPTENQKLHSDSSSDGSSMTDQMNE